MASLQSLLGKEDKFFELLEASAQEVCHSVQALKEFIQNSSQAQNLADFAESRKKDKAITYKISDMLCTTFVTAMEREDIEDLANVLYKIPKAVEKVAARIQLAPQLCQSVDFTQPVEMLDQATATLLEMIQQLREGGALDKARRMNERLQSIEGEADKLVLEQLKELFSGRIEATKVVFLKDLFELLEKVTDRCRDAGNIIIRIVLKNT